MNTSFFASHPEYVIAEQFLEPGIRGLQDDDTTLKSFTNETWKKFDPRKDDRLNYMKSFWGGQGVSLDGSYASMWAFEKWLWKEAEKWLIANPRPSAVWYEVGGWQRDESVSSEIIGDELVSLARDVSIYHAHCVLTETQLSRPCRVQRHI